MKYLQYLLILVIFMTAFNYGVSEEIHDNVRHIAQHDQHNRALFECNFTANPDTRSLESRLKDLFDEMDPGHIPYLPYVFNVNPTGKNASLSLTLARLHLEGLTDIRVTHSDLPTLIQINNFKIQVNITWNNLAIIAEKYTAGGHILNVFFSGKSNARIGFSGLGLGLNIHMKKVGGLIIPKYCFESEFYTILDHMDVNFNNINPGTDSGDTINKVLGTFGQDIMEYIESLFGESISNTVDKIMVDTVFPYLSEHCKPWPIKEVLYCKAPEAE